MVWVIVVVAIAVLGVAAWAGTGRLGEMPEVVSDRPKAHIPEGPVDGEFLDALSLPRVSTGYRCSQVDALLSAHVAGDVADPDARFDVVRRGYDMQAVDAVLARMRRSPGHAGSNDTTEVDTESAGADVSAEEVAPGEPASDKAERVHQSVPPDDDSAPSEELAETPSRTLPAV